MGEPVRPVDRHTITRQGLLISLRIVALIGPFYILFKGRGIAAAPNLSLAVIWSFNTAWHVCHFVYL